MRKRKNIGVSMVEILISVAVFSILMIPIVSGIISSLKNTTKAKTLQYRNEFAENVIEYVKEDSLVNILKGEYLDSVGSYASGSNPIDVEAYFHTADGTIDSSLSDLYDALKKKYGESKMHKETDADTMGSKTYPYEEYVVTGKVRLGTEHEEYVYRMEFTNKDYADLEFKTAVNHEIDDTKPLYVNPNNLALGIVEDIDHTKVALINGTIANYDSAVSNAFYTKKLQEIKKVDEVWYEISVGQLESTNLFNKDTATRQIIITVSGSESDGYSVKCGLKYKDNCETHNDEIGTAMADYYIEYQPFEFNYEVDSSTGKAKLPNIYLMYNVCVYNNHFSPDDYIVFNTEGMKDDTAINCFVVQTAEKYSDNVANALGNEEYKSKNAEFETESAVSTRNTSLYNNQVKELTGTVSNRSDVRVHLVATMGSTLSNLSIYNNFGQAGTCSDIRYNNTQAEVLKGLSNTEYKPLVEYDASYKKIAAKSIKNYGSLDSAQEEARGLYDVKMWIQQGSDPSKIDTSKKATITATKGGNES